MTEVRKIADLIPDGLVSIPFFIDEDEAQILLNLIDSNSDYWYSYGFEQLRRAQSYSVLRSPSQTSEDQGRLVDEYHLDITCFRWLVDRFMEIVPLATKRNITQPTEIFVEERFPSLSQPTPYDNIASSTFEYPSQPNDEGTSLCSCYVAYLTLLYPCTQYMNKPRERDIDCWPLETENHQLNFIMDCNALVLKWGEALDWRYRIFPTRHIYTEPLEQNENLLNRIITIKFKCSSNNILKTHTKNLNTLIPKLHTSSLNNSKLSELLTIVVTTSPIKSHPSTELIERVFDTFYLGGHDFAYECPKVIICDGCRVIEEEEGGGGGESKPPDVQHGDMNSVQQRKVSRKHANTKQALRNGIATIDQSENYKAFKVYLRQICEKATSQSPFFNTKLVELEERHGYGFALRAALRDHVFTPYVCVIQHDRTFMRKTPVKKVIEAMVHDDHEQIKYVGLSMRSNLIYRDIFCSKYGKVAASQLCDLVLMPEDLVLEKEEWSQSIEEMKSLHKSSLWENLLQLSQTYLKSFQYSSHAEMLQKRRFSKSDPCISTKQIQCSLTPTAFWYDNVHICRTDHYRDFVFSWKYKMVKNGGFVEDKLSPALVRNLEKHGLKEGHAKFGCYLLDDHSGFFFTGHMDGGDYIAGKNSS